MLLLIVERIRECHGWRRDMVPYDQLDGETYDNYLTRLKSDIEFNDERNRIQVEHMKRQHAQSRSYRVDLLEKQ
ncbi:hypothetical protein Hdeb2414_s0008g00296441 [Helianthus debilis subsp. tardiflorus]